MNGELLEFQYIKKLYVNDANFAQVFVACENKTCVNFIPLMAICLERIS